MRLAFLAALLLAVPALALAPPAAPAGRVSDYAGLLSQGARSEIEDLLARGEASSGSQVVVAIFPSLEGDSIEDFSIRLAEAWKIGRKGKDDGAILVVFPNDRQMRIEVGYGLEDRLTDGRTGRIVREVIAPRFQEGNFDAGVRDGVQAIFAAIGGAEAAPKAGKRPGGHSFLPLFLLFLVLLFVLPRIPGVRLGRRTRWGRTGGTWIGGGTRSSGWGGGFRGGGGSFGGGGASGRW